MSAPRWLCAGGLLVLMAGGVLLVRSVVEFVGNPAAPSSTSGVRVFRLPDGTLGGFEPYVVGLEPVIMGVGLVLLVAAALVGAAQPRSRTLASTSGSNAEAHTR